MGVSRLYTTCYVMLAIVSGADSTQNFAHSSVDLTDPATTELYSKPTNSEPRAFSLFGQFAGGKGVVEV